MDSEIQQLNVIIHIDHPNRNYKESDFWWILELIDDQMVAECESQYLAEEASGVLGAGVSLSMMMCLVPIGGTGVAMRLIRLVRESVCSAFCSCSAAAWRCAKAHILHFKLSFLLLIILPCSRLLQSHIVYWQPSVCTHQLPDLPQAVKIGLRGWAWEVEPRWTCFALAYHFSVDQ